MSKLSIVFIQAVIVAIICACAKTEALPDAAGSAAFSCGHSALSHRPAQPPTLEDFGSAEYWECTGCGQLFCDSGAKTPFTGFKYILPTKYVDLTDYLPQYRTKSEIGTIAAIINIAGLAVTIGSLVTTVVSLSDATDEIADKIDELSKLEDKNAEQLQMLQELNDELVVKIGELNGSLTRAQQSAGELVDQMNTTQQLMDSADALEDAVLCAIMKAENDIEVSKLLDARYQKIQDLKFSCVCALRSMEEYFSLALADLESSQTREDSLTIYSDMRRHITSVISDWGSERAGYPSLTSTLLAEFMGMAYDDNSSFPDLLAKVAADTDVLPFDHQILLVKELFTERELCILSLANALSGCYYRNCCGGNNLYAFNTADAMDRKLSQCLDLRDVFHEKWIDESNAAPWHCNVTGKYFQGSIVWLDAKGFVSGNTMTMKNGRMVSSGRSLSSFYGVSEEEAITEQELELMRKDFLLLNGYEARDLNELLFSTGRPGMIFVDTCPADYAGNVRNLAFSIPYSQNEYFSLDGKDLYYNCTGMDFKFCPNLVEYYVVNNPDPNGSNICNYLGNNGRTRFYTVRATSTK